MLIVGENLSLTSFLGLVILVGVVVNNAIVLVDYANQLRSRTDMSPTDAILNASARRLRPVLMTALTTIFGLLPMALGTGEGSEIWRSLGIAAVGGLAVSTFVTLFLIPVLYSLLDRFRVRRFDSVSVEES